MTGVKMRFCLAGTNGKLKVEVKSEKPQRKMQNYGGLNE